MNNDCIIVTQLHDVKVRRMAELLEKTQSSYFPAFKKIFKDVVAGKFFLTGILTMGGLLLLLGPLI